MFRSFALTAMALMSFALLPGCGGSQGGTEVIAPPETTSMNVDADRAKEAGGSEPEFIDYSKQ